MPVNDTSGSVGRLLGEFGELLPAEEQLRDACRAGKAAWISGARPEKRTAANHIRPEVLRVFCLGLDPAAPVHEHGVLVRGAWIGGGADGDLDLRGCDLPSPLALWNCRLTGHVVAYDAKAKQLIFDGSQCAGIKADRLACVGDVFFRAGFRAEGEVRLLGANIGGDLDCTNGTFAAGEGNALSFDGTKIGGNVLLKEKFRAEAAVRFPGAEICGDLVCIGGRFEEERSLDLTKSKIGGTAFFIEGFHAAGRVDLRAAAIDVLVDEDVAWEDSTLLLDGLTIRRFAADAPVEAAARIRWLERQPSDHLGRDFRPQPWEECARVLAEMGHERDARILRIEKRRRMRWLDWDRVKTGKTRNAVRRAWRVWLARRRTGRDGALIRQILAARLRAHFACVTSKVAKVPGIVLDVGLDVATGYGWRPLRALCWLFLLWIAAGIGYATLPAGVMAPTDALVYLSPRIPEECKSAWVSSDPRTVPLTDARQIATAEALGLSRHERGGLQIVPEWKEICTRAMPSEYSTFSPFAYALDVLLPIVDLRQEHDWSPRVTDAAGQVIAPLWDGATWGWGYVARLAE